MTANKASAHAELDPDFEASSTAPINFIRYLHYELRSRLGKSATSEVYEAWDTKLCRAVAIKKLKNKDRSSPDTLADEARAAASLQHAAFIKTHAIEDDDEGHSIVMELAHGTPLKDWIKLNLNKENPENNEARALGIVAQIAEALQEAHAIKLIHGDLKPAKLLIDNAGKIRILDTGLASNNNPNEVATVGQIDPAGSIAYMAPERFATPAPSAASDIYALGTILYETLTGSTPFATLNGLALIAAQVQSTSEQWQWPSTISAPVRQLIQAMTTRQPDQRLNSAQVVEECKKLGATESHSNSAASINLSALQAELANTIHQQKKRKFVIGTILAAVFIGITAIGAWQTKPYWPQIVKALTPYSEAREMELGIADLIGYMNVPAVAKLDSASEHFTTILERTAESADAIGYMSLVYLSRYHAEKRDEIWLQKAKASAQQSVKLNARSAIGQVASAKMLVWHHKLNLAMEAANIAMMLEPENIFVWHTKMSILLESRQYSEAIAFAEVGIQRFPDDRFLLDLEGSAYLSQRNFREAERIFRLSLARQPDSANAYALLAQALEGQNRFVEALEVIQHGLEVRPNAYLYATLGEAKFVQGDFAGAVLAFANATSPDKGVSGSYARWFQLAEALIWVPGRSREGIVAYEKARDLLQIRLNRSPDDDELLVFMSLISARLGDVKKAEDFALQVLTLAPNDPHRLFFAGLAFELIGKRDLAIDSILKAKRFGYSIRTIDSHPILRSLRNDPRFH